MKFSTTLLLAGKTATGVAVPAEVVEALGGGGRIPVRVRIAGVEYASSVVMMNGETRIPVSAEIRAAAGIAAGDTIQVDVVRDDKPRTVQVPNDLRTALNKDPAILARFEALSYTNQRRHVLSVTAARTAQTRDRRVGKVITELSLDGRT